MDNMMDIDQIKDDVNKLKLDIVKIDCSNDRFDERHSEFRGEFNEMDLRVRVIEKHLSQSAAIKKMVLAVLACAAIIIPLFDILKYYY